MREWEKYDQNTMYKIIKQFQKLFENHIMYKVLFQKSCNPFPKQNIQYYEKKPPPPKKGF